MTIDTTDSAERAGIVDFAKVVVRRKRLIAGIVVLSVLIGVFVSLVPPRIYMVDSILEVGTYPGEKDVVFPIESPQQLTEKVLTGSYDASIRSALSLTDRKPLNIKAENPDNTNLVHLYIRSTNPSRDTLVLGHIDMLILTDHQRRFDARASTVSGATLTSVVKAPTVSSAPLNQKMHTTILFAAFVGLFIALLVAFGKEWWQRSLQA